MLKRVGLFLILFVALSLNVQASEQYKELEEQARAYYSLGNTNEAMLVFSKIPEESRTKDDWLLIGNLCLDVNKPLDAIYMYNRALALDPKCWKAYYNLGNIYLSDEQPNKAIAYFKQAYKYNKNFAYIQYNIGCAYIKLENYSAAKNHISKAITLKTDVSNFYYQLAYCYKKLNKPKQAQKYLDVYKELVSRG